MQYSFALFQTAFEDDYKHTYNTTGKEYVQISKLQLKGEKGRIKKNEAKRKIILGMCILIEIFRT